MTNNNSVNNETITVAAVVN